MSSPVSMELDGAVAVVTIDNPPVNALSRAVRTGLLESVERADADDAARAIVIVSRGKTFVAGADIREFDAGPLEPLLPDVLMRVESCCKPVIAALQGAALGGGFELALASHYRCATPAAQAGLPEVKLGLLPGAGGTLRLPRLIDLRAALDMITGGEPIPASRMQTLGIVDRLITEGDLRAAAVAWANELVRSGAAPRRLRDAPVRGAEAADASFFETYRRGLPRAIRKLEAVDRILRSVEAGLRLPFEAASAEARRLFMECRDSGESRALRHLFFAERGNATPPGATPRAVSQVAVIGAGTMGSGIAVSFASSGFPVALIDSDAASLERGLGRIRSALEAATRRSKLSEADARQALERIRASGDLAQASKADLVVEAVFEKLSVKQEIFGRLDELCRPGAVLATNTSTLDVDAIAAATKRPGDVIGMHFFSPANVMRLVEIVRAKATAPDVIATALAVTRGIGKLGVVVGNCFGFVGNRMLYGYGRENQLMLLEGVPPERIDRVLEEFGMAMGPNAVGDLAGLDIGYAVRRERKDKPDDPRYYRIADLLVEHGRLGQKTGKGMFRYEAGSREPLPDPEVSALIEAEARRLGIPRREISDEEILQRCLCALVNEGARILDEGIAEKSSDIDVIWCNGYGFPRTRGGPMFYADTLGLHRVLETIRRFARGADARYWQPAPLLVRLVEAGETFGMHDRREKST